MPDVIPPARRPGRHLLAVSIACFAVAGVSASAIDSVVPTLGATGVSIVGVYALARYAKVVSRRTLAVAALCYWITFLGIAGIHAIGVETIGSIAPGSAAATVLVVTAITWATFLSACGTTMFLGFREYGSRTGCEAPEDRILDGETTSDY